MTLPSSGLLTMYNVMDELRIANPARAFPISLLDSDVVALAGKSGPPINLLNLYGKSAFSATGINSVDNNYSTTITGGTATSSPTVGVVGSGSYSFTWSFTSNPNSATLSNSTNQTCTVSKAFTKLSDGSFSATLQCVIHDNVGGGTITVSNVQAVAAWNS